MTSEFICWRGREATRLANDRMELISLTDGGHLAEFRFLEKSGFPSQNVLWEAPWITPKPNGSRLEELSQTAGFTGHALCLDYFGAPSPDEAMAGLPIHGEAGIRRWNANGNTNNKTAACQWNVNLPVTRLSFERKIHLREHESTLYVEESVENERDEAHAFQCVQHATFAPPFLNPDESTLAVSAIRGMTSPLDYERGSLLAIDREFSWPYAPCKDADGTTLDLRKPFSVKHRGFCAAVLLDPGREVEFLLAMNWKLRLGVGYCFRRSDFPWMAIWEENCTRQGKPWNGTTQARGMEFGNTPLPLGREEIFRRGKVFDTSTSCVVPARGKWTTRYLIFLFTIPDGMHSIENLEMESDAIVLHDDSGRFSLSIPTLGCRDFLARGDRLRAADDFTDRSR